MTFAEAKDRVAREKPKPDSIHDHYHNFDDLCEWVREGWASPNILIECTNEAAELYAASVREEADNGFKEILSLKEPDNKHGMNDWDRGYLKGIEDAQDIAKEAIEKLTAPWR